MFLLLFLSLAAADTADTGAIDRRPLHGSDADDDGWPDSVDCEPLDIEIYPGAFEACNAVDDDCDGEIDEAEEECGNGVDDDCDGKVDEKCGCGAEDGYARDAYAFLLLPFIFLFRRRV